jgi:MFS transporter, FSR family, fosmidomycin resistance protein
LQASIPDHRAHSSNLAVTLISAGHFLSHFYALALPAMFLTLKETFNVTYLELGLAVTAYNLLGGLAQAPMGFVVDRVGPRIVLLIGLGLNAIAIALMGLAGTYEMLLMLALIAGLGNSVFHPADYALLSGSVTEERLGRAYSIHTFAGFFGSACAPIVMLSIAALFDWRTAFMIVGGVGLAVLGCMILMGGCLLGEAKTETADDDRSGLTGLRLITSPAILLFLLFFVFYGLAAGGLVAFTASTLIGLHGISTEWANIALSGHLFGVVGGVVLAGLAIDRIGRHTTIASLSLLLAGSVVLLPLANSWDGLSLTLIMTMVGVGLGSVLPPRDLMVRAATPSGQSGKTFGFVFVGYTVGASLSPLLFGWLLDSNQPTLVFVLAALFVLLSLFAILSTQWVSSSARQ